MIQQLPNFEDDRRWQSALSKNWPKTSTTLMQQPVKTQIFGQFH